MLTLVDSDDEAGCAGRWMSGLHFEPDASQYCAQEDIVLHAVPSPSCALVDNLLEQFAGMYRDLVVRRVMQREVLEGYVSQGMAHERSQETMSVAVSDDLPAEFSWFVSEARG